MTSILFLLQTIQLKKSDAFISKTENFYEFFCHFFKLKLNFYHFQKKKMTLIAYVFSKIGTPKDVAK